MAPGSLGYKAYPQLKDKTHVVVFVVDATNVNVMPQTTVDKLKAMREQAIQRSELKKIVVPTLTIWSLSASRKSPL